MYNINKEIEQNILSVELFNQINDYPYIIIEFDKKVDVDKIENDIWRIEKINEYTDKIVCTILNKNKSFDKHNIGFLNNTFYFKNFDSNQISELNSEIQNNTIELEEDNVVSKKNFEPKFNEVEINFLWNSEEVKSERYNGKVKTTHDTDKLKCLLYENKNNIKISNIEFSDIRQDIEVDDDNAICINNNFNISYKYEYKYTVIRSEKLSIITKNKINKKYVKNIKLNKEVEYRYWELNEEYAVNELLIYEDKIYLVKKTFIASDFIQNEVNLILQDELEIYSNLNSILELKDSKMIEKFKQKLSFLIEQNYKISRR